MARFTIQRFFQMLVALVGVSILMFFLTCAIPGDFVDSSYHSGLSTEQAENLRQAYGLGLSPVERYFNWAANVIQGNLGDSLLYHQPVIQVIAPFFLNSALLAGVSVLILLCLSIPGGVLSAAKPSKAFDRAMTIVSVLSVCIPVFLVAKLLQQLFSIWLGWLPLSGISSAGVTPAAFSADSISHLFLPAAALAFSFLGYLLKNLRSSMLETSSLPYISAAKSRGISKNRILWRHMLRSALSPFINLVGTQIPVLLTGSVIVEQVFAYPGMGRLLLSAVNKRDYPLMMGIVMLCALLVLVSSFACDLVSHALDPRTKQGGHRI